MENVKLNAVSRSDSTTLHFTFYIRYIRLSVFRTMTPRRDERLAGWEYYSKNPDRADGWRELGRGVGLLGSCCERGGGFIETALPRRARRGRGGARFGVMRRDAGKDGCDPIFRVAILPEGPAALAKCKRPKNRCRHRLFRRKSALYSRQT